MSALLLDLDGVLYEGERPISGAAEALARLGLGDLPHLFVTNTTSRPRSALVDKLGHFGIPTDTAHILTPPVAASRWLRDNVSGPLALFVPPATRADFDGLPVLAEQAEKGAAAVIVGDLGDAWDFETLNRAFRLLMDPAKPPLVALGMTRYWRAADGLRLDAGAFVSALQYASGRQAVVMGKPAAPFFQAALGLLSALPADTVMVGDDIRSDIAAALRLGMRGVLVRTGKFRPVDVEGDVHPSAVLDSIRDLPQWWTHNASSP